MGNIYKALLSPKSRKFDLRIQLNVPEPTLEHNMWGLVLSITSPRMEVAMNSAKVAPGKSIVGSEYRSQATRKAFAVSACGGMTVFSGVGGRMFLKHFLRACFKLKRNRKNTGMWTLKLGRMGFR
jgi:hypothetical protein